LISSSFPFPLTFAGTTTGGVVPVVPCLGVVVPPVLPTILAAFVECGYLRPADQAKAEAALTVKGGTE
jgi:uncharacterized membrane protein